MPHSSLSELRSAFHQGLLDQQVLSISKSLIASNADGSQKQSRAIALFLAETLGASPGVSRLKGQTAGSRFEHAVQSFVAATVPSLSGSRYGSWRVENIGGKRKERHLAGYEPYTHLAGLANAIEVDPTLETVLGNSYEISPDVIVVRTPPTLSDLNSNHHMVDSVDRFSPTASTLVARRDIVHAVISCKWTIRSDRAQNSRSEALNLIRNRKGRTPHIAVVTGEPTPSRIASLALGTGDVDMVYHFALPELVAAVNAAGSKEARGLLQRLIEGHRLRDITELAVDLSI